VDMKKILTLVGCAAWAAVAVSSSSPAHAIARTSQNGMYATCATGFMSQVNWACGNQYIGSQIIKFQETACSGGGCATISNGAMVTFKYPYGRSQASLISTCNYQNVYGLYSCAC
jgi:hypothetical protein